MKQATVFDGFLFDAVSLPWNRLVPAAVNARRGWVFQALRVARVVAVLDEALDLRFEIARDVAEPIV